MKYDSLNNRYDAILGLIHRNQLVLNVYALVRLILCCSVIGGLLIGYFYDFQFLYVIAFVAMIAFFVVVYFHTKLYKKHTYLLYEAEVYKRHLLRMSGKWDDFKDDGHEFLEQNVHLSMDLDLFGHHSLYQMINVCFTSLGKKKLAHYLTSQSDDVMSLKSRQEAVIELANRPEFVYQIETYGQYSQDVYLPRINSHKVPSLLLPNSMALLTCLSFLLMITHTALPLSTIIFEVCLVIQLILTFLKFSKHQQLFDPVFNLQKSLSHYKQLCDAIEKEEFHSVYLKEQQISLKKSHASLALEQLSHLSDFVHYRHNILVFLLANIFFSYDYFCAFAFSKWHHEYGKYISVWLDCIANIEVCMSLAVTSIDDFEVSMPHICDEQFLSFKNIRHPLINQNHVVGNDWDLKKNINVITGSNMSGKTTFMRSIALNLILAYAGGFVFCDECTCSIMHIYTSMRVKDNVEEGISTFYGELLRIKEMLDACLGGEPMICFIDEIFKGTNSLDRLAGARATIQRMNHPHCITMMTTHDFELCSLDEIENYHFDEYYENNHICFSYKLQNGPCHSTNGLFLLRQLGIVEDK